MQKQELRLGNLVKKDNLIIKIVDWMEHGEVLTSRSDGVMYVYEVTDLEPIPLGKTWLNRMGFFKPTDEPLYEKKDYGFQGVHTRGCYDLDGKHYIVNDNHYDGFHIPCEYVHQLQNINYILFNEELL